jgi:lipopolysaccharide transport system ATP-binding protein
MSGAVITVYDLGKRYSLRHQSGEGYTTLRDVIAHKIKHLFRRNGDAVNPTSNIQHPKSEDFWALRHVSFEVKQGEVLGIIGRNGAGKSTLLKILSRITDPTEGRVRLRGRVASLLEVGTGFHPELTGRENIYLNGAILGMNRAEIRNRFDEIVAFAETEKFLDTPVKRYSSGMYVRLAFAVAAHLEPEILIIDEVLAVGDAEFQKKCLGKMGEVARGGRTILFVSHDMSAVKRLCSRAILLRDGLVAIDNTPELVVADYLTGDMDTSHATISLEDYRDRSGDGSARILEASLRNDQMELCNAFSVGDTVVIEYRVHYHNQSTAFSHSIEITNSDGIPLYHLWDLDSRAGSLAPQRERVIRARMPVDLFPDRYFVTCWVGDSTGTRADRVGNCLSFTVEQASSRINRVLSKQKGLVYKTAEWSYELPGDGSST